MIAGLQIRAARAMLRWSAEELGRRAGVSHQTIHRIEQVDGVSTSRGDTLERIEKVLREAGVELIGSSAEAPGVRWLGDVGSESSR